MRIAVPDQLKSEFAIEGDTWRQKAKFVIQEAFTEWANAYQKMPSPSMPEPDKKRFIKLIDGFYPFGQRAHFPYKVWLEERRKVVLWLTESNKPILDGLFAEAA